jgi:uncharacterized protein involved in exopolysaccharide biosynthesis
MPNSPTLPAEIRASWSLSDLAWIWNLYRRRWLVVLTAWILTLVVTAIVVVAKGVRYEVGSAIYYQLGAEILPPPLVAKESVVVTRRAEDVNTEIEILRSPHLVEKVIADLGEDFFRDPPPTTALGRAKAQMRRVVDSVQNGIQEVLIQARMRRRLSRLEKITLVFQHALRVEPVRNADVVNVTMQVTDPEAGKFILEKILEEYLKSHQAAHRKSGMSEFFQQQHAQVKSELDTSSEELLAFQNEHGAWSADHQRLLLLDRRRLLQQEYSATLARMSRLDTEVSELDKALSGLPPVVELSRTEQRNPAIDDTEQSLAALDLNLATLTTAFSEGAREVEDKTRQISFLKERMTNLPPMILFTTTTGISQTFQEINKERKLKSAELEGLKQMATTQKKQLAEMDQELPALEKSIVTLTALQREHALLEKNYALYSENLEKSRIEQAMNHAEISNVSIISPPTASLLPVWPSLKLVLAAALLVGFGIGSALAFLLEVRRAARAPVA